LLKKKTKVKPKDKPKLGAELFKLRKEQGLSQTELAELTGLTAAAICNYEKGSRIPYLQSFYVICKALKADSNLLLEACNLTPLGK